MVVIAAATAMLALTAVASPGARAEYGASSVRIEVRVWQGVADELDIRVSARPADGSWRTLGTIPLPLDDGLSSSGRYRYGDITLSTPLRDSSSPATLQVRLWQDVDDSGALFVSARPAGGSWRTLGTVRLLLDDGFSGDGRFRFGDIALEVPPGGRVLSLAGRRGGHGFRDGQGDGARFGYWDVPVRGLTVDRDGSVVVADFPNHAIRRISPDGTVRTIAGGAGIDWRDGPAEEAQFYGPSDVAVDSRGAIYVVETYGNRIRKISPDGMVTTVAGAEQPEVGGWLRRDGPADEALFISPSRIALSPDGDLYVTDLTLIRRLSPSGWVTTFAGSDPGYKDGPKESAEFGVLRGIDVDAEGNVYVLDQNHSVPERRGTHYLVRKIDTSGYVSTVFWSDPPTAGGPLAAPAGMAVSPEGEVYLSNTGLHQIVRVLGPTQLQAVAGTGEDGYRDGSYDEAALSEPGALELSPGGALVVMDQADSVVRVVLPEEDGSFPGTVLAAPPAIPRLDGVGTSLFAGSVGLRGFVDGPASEASFSSPKGLAFAADGSLLVADSSNHAIRRISPDGVVSTLAGNNGPRLRDGPADAAQFAWPESVAVAGDGTIYVADTGNGLIRRLTPDGTVETLDVEGSPFSAPEGLVVDAGGDLLFTEYTPHGVRVRRLTPEGELSDVVDETIALARAFVLDKTNTLFFATSNHLRTSIRKVAEGGIVSVVFEDIPTYYGGVLSLDVPALALALDGTLYAADLTYGRVVRITPDGEAAIVVDRDSVNSQKFQPVAILITPEGDLLVADQGMSVIWKISLPANEDDPARDVGALFDQIVDSLRRVPIPDAGDE